MTGHDQGKINGRLIAAGRVAWRQYGDKPEEAGYVFLKNNGFVSKVDQKMMESLGVTMEAMTDCVKQLDEMGDIKVRDAIRQNSGPTHSGLVIGSKVDPRVCMVVSMEDSNQDETDLGIAWFLDHEGLKDNMGNEALPEKALVAQELDAITPAREAAKLMYGEMGECVDEFGIPLTESSDKRHSLKELQAMPTLAQGLESDLKVDDGETRIWLARTGVEDGEPYDNKVTIEKLRGGRWVTVDEYMAESKEPKKKPLKENVEHLSDSEISTALDAIADALSQKGFLVSSTGSELHVWKKGQKKLGFYDLVVGSAVRSPGAKHLSGADVMLIWSHTGKEDQEIYHDVQVGFDSDGEVKSIADLASHLNDSFLSVKSKKTEGSALVAETGEPDGDYDHALYDAITNAIKKKTGLDASHREFDKYQGVVISVSKKGKHLARIWTIESSVIGKAKKDDAKFLSAELISDGESVSYNYGYYFMMKPEDRVGDLLVLTRLDGTTRKIKNPKKKDLPDLGDVRTTIQYEGEPSDVLSMWIDTDDQDDRHEVTVSPDRKKVDLGTLEFSLKHLAKVKMAKNEGIEDMLGLEPLSEEVLQTRDIIKTGDLFESTVSQTVVESRGSGWGEMQKDKKVTSIDQIAVGDILLDKSNQFNAKNVIKVTAKMGDKFKGVFVDPSDTAKKRLPDDREFVIWDFDLMGDSNEYYHPKKDVKETKEDMEMSESKKDFESICEEVDMFGVPKFLTEKSATHMKAGSALAKPTKEQGTKYDEKDAPAPKLVMSPEKKDAAIKAGASKLDGDKDGMVGHVSAKTKLEKEGMIPKASPDRGETKLNDTKIKVGKAVDGVGDHVEGDGGESDDHQKPVQKSQVKPGAPKDKPKVMAEMREARMERIKAMHKKKIEEMKAKKMAEGGYGQKAEGMGKMLPKGHSPLKKKVVNSESSTGLKETSHSKPVELQNIDSREEFAMIKEASAVVKHGFDLTDISADDFKKILKTVGAKEEAEKENIGHGVMAWVFSGPGIKIVTSNNPITGECASGRRKDEVGYAGYVGIEGKADKVADVVSGIKSMASYTKDESPGTRDYI